METVMRNKTVRNKLPASFHVTKYVQKFFFHVLLHHLTIFDEIQRDFVVFPNITIGNLWKPFHYVIIIPFSTFS